MNEPHITETALTLRLTNAATGVSAEVSVPADQQDQDTANAAWDSVWEILQSLPLALVGAADAIDRGDHLP